MPTIYIKETLGRNVLKGTIKTWPRAVVNTVALEVGNHEWYELAESRPGKPVGKPDAMPEAKRGRGRPRKIETVEA
tara:strand:- start:294 stop:521 length:228 start_codon:yes stop_codon:yes gene_type:complete